MGFRPHKGLDKADFFRNPTFTHLFRLALSLWPIHIFGIIIIIMVLVDLTLPEELDSES